MPQPELRNRTTTLPPETTTTTSASAKPFDQYAMMKKNPSETATLPAQQIFKTLNYLRKKKAELAADKEEKMPSFRKGPCFRFELCKVVPRHTVDPRVNNHSGYDELLLFGIIQAETCFTDQSHNASFSIFNRNFDDPLVFTNPGSLSPQDISNCSLSVSTSVQITAKLYATTYKGCKICGCMDDYWKYYPHRPHTRIPYVACEEAKQTIYIQYDALEISKDYAFINFSEYFANRPNGGSGSCKLNGSNGNLELYYVALKDAVDATLEVVIAETSKDTKVAGKIMAYFGKNFDYGSSPAEKDHYSAMLYETKPGDFVKPGKINLMRSMLAVPAQFSLIIDANLRDFTSGDIVLSGVYEFPVPAEGGVKVAFIKGNDCSLKLIVDWKLPLHDMLSV